MKIQDLIQLEKIDNGLGYMNGVETNYQKKKGYYWKIPSHSQNESVLLNNYEKDCVVAYIENKYLTVFLIKIGGINNFKGYIYVKNFLKGLINSYTIINVYSKKKILQSFEEDKENLKINNNKEYKKFIKLLILERMED